MKGRNLNLRTLTYFLSMCLCILPYGTDAQHIAGESMDSFLIALQKEASIPALSFAAFENGEINYSYSKGVLNLNEKDSINQNTIFEAASLTKPIAAICAMKLIEEGILELDKALSEYLKYPSLAHDKKHTLVTARMVLSHTSGLPNWRSPRNSEKVKFKFKPGKKFSYSGEGFVYLQRVMEVVTGKDLSAIAEELVFKPLGMKKSALVFNYEDNYAIGHGKDLEVQRKFKPKESNAAYSLHTNANEYALFMGEFFTPTLINKNLMQLMTSKQELMKREDEALGWGLGIGLNFVHEETFAWHWGDNGAFKAFSIISNKTGKGFVFFANCYAGLSIVKRLLENTYNGQEVMETWDFYDQI